MRSLELAALVLFTLLVGFSLYCRLHGRWGAALVLLGWYVQFYSHAIEMGRVGEQASFAAGALSALGGLILVIDIVTSAYKRGELYWDEMTEYQDERPTTGPATGCR